MKKAKKGAKGVTLTEMLVVTTIIILLILAAIFAYLHQIAKSRDAKRKADLNKLQSLFEDYLNDYVCYPDETVITDRVICRNSFLPYTNELPCDPLNNWQYNYFYSYDTTQDCQSWYKVYTRLENTKDPVIEEIGCAGGCGPSGNYNYWVSSPNMAEVAELPGEVWPEIPMIGGESPTPSPEGPTATPAGPSVTPQPSSTPFPTATPGGPSLTPSPTPTPTTVCVPSQCSFAGVRYCPLGEPLCGQCCPEEIYRCFWHGITAECCLDPACPE
jgi:type II secretory pathway pseudopilin PulG